MQSFIHTLTRSSAHSCTLVYAHTHTHMCARSHPRTSAHSCTLLLTNTHTRTSAHSYTLLYTHTHTRTSAHSCTLVYTHTHTRTSYILMHSYTHANPRTYDRHIHMVPWYYSVKYLWPKFDLITQHHTDHYCAVDYVFQAGGPVKIME